MDHSSSSILKSEHPLLARALAKRADPNRGTREQSYFDHLHQVYLAWLSLIEVHDGLIERVAELTGVAKLAILQSSLLCVALHDVGKLSENFQRMMRAETESDYRRAVSMNFRHEVIPLCLVRALSQKIAFTHSYPLLGNGVLEVMAVAGHHKYLADGYLLDEDNFIQMIAWCEPLTLIASLKAAMALCEAMFTAQGWVCPSISPKDVNLRYGLSKHITDAYIPFILKNNRNAWRCLVEHKKEVAHLRSTSSCASLRAIFGLLKGLLMTADWMASSANESAKFLDAGNDVVRVSPNAIKPYLVDRCTERNKMFAGFLPFQQTCADACGHVLAVAPTGSGKTEASMLWGLRQIESGVVKKLIFLLPTMVTANSFHRHMLDFFDTRHGHHVALVHSTADLIRSLDNPSVEDESDGKSRSDAFNLRDPHLFAPVTVGTIDQLLVTLMHSGHWAIKTLAAANSAIVVDELHAYDPHTAGLVMLMLKQFRFMGTRFMVMSATMPSDLRHAVIAALHPGPMTLIEEKSLLSEARNQWETLHQPLTAWIGMGIQVEGIVSEELEELIEQKNHAGKSVQILVVVNTVKRCQEIARHLQQYNPICYHSKFTFDDRRKKEQAIENGNPRLLIATQVVEVSLDIDYDILLTECAPIDALIQRAGRVNRPRRNVPGRVIVFLPETGSDHIYGEPRGILDCTWNAVDQLSNQRLTEQQLLDLVEKVYAGKDIAKNNDFTSIQRAVEALQEQLSGVLDSPKPHELNASMKTRLEKYAQVTVIPNKFASECRDGSYKHRRKYELKVPLWYFQQFPDEESSDDFRLCAMDYDEHYGAQLYSNDSIPAPGHMIF